MAVHLRRPAFIEGTQCVELMRNLFITQGVVEPVIQIQELWDGQWNVASANVSFKQTSTESHQPKKSQLPIKSNANILGLGFYPVIINKDQFRIRTYLSKIPLDKAKNREKQIHLRNISLSQLEFLTRDSFTHKKKENEITMESWHYVGVKRYGLISETSVRFCLRQVSIGTVLNRTQVSESRR